MAAAAIARAATGSTASLCGIIAGTLVPGGEPGPAGEADRRGYLLPGLKPAAFDAGEYGVPLQRSGRPAGYGAVRRRIGRRAGADAGAIRTGFSSRAHTAPKVVIVLDGSPPAGGCISALTALSRRRTWPRLPPLGTTRSPRSSVGRWHAGRAEPFIPARIDRAAGPAAAYMIPPSNTQRATSRRSAGDSRRVWKRAGRACRSTPSGIRPV